MLLAPDCPGSICPACLWSAMEDEATDRPGGDAPEGGGFRVGKHRISGEIARGGMGIVYRAEEEESGREVALKMLLGHLSETPGMRERFRIEGRAAAALDHSAILPVYQIGEQDGVPYFTMRLAPGGSLSQRRGDFAGQWRRIAELVARLADALGYAHRHGMLHRDIKPGNILFDAGGEVFLGDFGLAKLIEEDSGLTMSAHLLGTPLYLAPEIADGDARAATVASDLWALGAVLYELLAGHPPFEASGIPSLLRKIAEDAPAALPKPVPRDLAIICLKCLEKVPAHRYSSSDELAADLRRWLTGHPIRARRTGATARAWAWVRRNPAVATLATAFAISIIAFPAALWRENRETRSALADSLLASAEGTIQSRQPGWRDRALDSLVRAAQLRPGDPEVARIGVLALSGADLTARRFVPEPGARSIVSPNAEWIAWRGEDEIRIARIDGSDERTISLPALGAAAVGPFSPDQRLLTIQGNFGTRLIGLAGQGEVARFPERFGSVAFTPDGRWFVGGTSKTPMVIADLEASPPAIGAMPAATKAHFPLCISPDGKTLLTATGEGNRGLTAFSLPSGERLRDYPSFYNEFCYRAIFSPDGAVIYAGLDSGAVYRLPAGGGAAEQIAHVGGRTIGLMPVGRSWLAVLPDWGFLGSLINLDTLSADYELPPGKAIAGIPGSPRFAIHEVERAGWILYDSTPSANASLITLPGHFAGRLMAEGAGHVSINDTGDFAAVTSGVGLCVFNPGEPSGIRRINDWRCFHLDADHSGRVAFAGIIESYWFAADLPETDARKSARLKGRGGFVSVAEDASLLAAVGTDHELHLYSLDGGEIPIPQALAGTQILSATIHPDGSAIAALHSGRKGIVVCALPSGVEIGFRPTTRKIPPLAFPGGTRLLIGDLEDYACWDYQTGTDLWRRPHQIKERRPSLAAAAWKANIAAITLDNRSIQLIDPGTGRDVLPPLAFPRQFPLESISLDARASYCAGLGGGAQLQVWDIGALRRALGKLGWQEDSQ